MDRGGRVASGCAGPACAPVTWAGCAWQRYKVASLLAGLPRRCPARTLQQTSAKPCAIGPEASGDRPSARSCTVVGKLRAGHLVGSAGTRLPCSRSPRDGPKQSGRERPSLRTQTVPSLAAARRAFEEAAPSSLEAAPSLGPRARATLRAPPRPCVDAGAQPGACVARQQSPGAREPVRTPSCSKRKSGDVKEHGLALRRDREEGRELPRV